MFRNTSLYKCIDTQKKKKKPRHIWIYVAITKTALMSMYRLYYSVLYAVDLLQCDITYLISQSHTQLPEMKRAAVVLVWSNIKCTEKGCESVNQKRELVDQRAATPQLVWFYENSWKVDENTEIQQIIQTKPATNLLQKLQMKQIIACNGRLSWPDAFMAI